MLEWWSKIQLNITLGFLFFWGMHLISILLHFFHFIGAKSLRTNKLLYCITFSQSEDSIGSPMTNQRPALGHQWPIRGLCNNSCRTAGLGETEIELRPGTGGRPQLSSHAHTVNTAEDSQSEAIIVSHWPIRGQYWVSSHVNTEDGVCCCLTSSLCIITTTIDTCYCFRPIRIQNLKFYPIRA